MVKLGAMTKKAIYGATPDFIGERLSRITIKAKITLTFMGNRSQYSKDIELRCQSLVACCAKQKKFQVEEM